jgi:hypothetical protein
MLLVLSLTAGLAGSLPAQAPADSGVFIVRHAGDTVAIERFSRTPVRLAGTLAIHNTLPLIELTVLEGGDTAATRARVVQRARVIFKDDSVAVDEVGGAGLMTRVFSTEKGAVPYLNLSFALLEQATRLASRGRSDIAFFNLGGGQTRTARLSRLGSDSVSLAIGDVEYHLRVDRTGRLLGARIPAQNVTVERQ